MVFSYQIWALHEKAMEILEVITRWHSALCAYLWKIWSWKKKKNRATLVFILQLRWKNVPLLLFNPKYYSGILNKLRLIIQKTIIKCLNFLNWLRKLYLGPIVPYSPIGSTKADAEDLQGPFIVGIPWTLIWNRISNTIYLIE